ncbi:GNAT family N-acetyltransferase [Mycetocola tolaasinivorans]|uniref:GNAT family N-acetyltransferase n=1 Tax=Mycetocola tolaasinivorans TaxID=76635 RepID=A0A3L7A3Y6_9MICO|nr:GNAT family N-acetyltransferase [Mycetocola tolaasinivorans]RLP74261.1 GNAT family N-acetyltransferase [Mycetocola tolaasinivorans]
MAITTRPLDSANPDELTAVLTLNNAAVPAVNALTTPELRVLIETSHLARAVVDSDSPAEILGVIIAFAPGAAYESENYAWFSARGGDFLYVDRIIVAETARGRGLGPVLYAAVFDAARAADLGAVTCEVNTDPPNPGSLAFHTRLGFERVGDLTTKGGTVSVALLEARVR